MSLALAPANGAFRPVSASAIALLRAAFAANMTEAPALAIVAEPMEAWDSGSLVSPSRPVTLSGGKPNKATTATAATVTVTGIVQASLSGSGTYAVPVPSAGRQRRRFPHTMKCRPFGNALPGRS